MSTLEQLDQDYQCIEQAIVFLETHFHHQPSLSEIAAAVQLSEYHFQRLFSRWVGISPKRFLQFLTKEYAKALLKNAHNILDAAYDAGLSGPGRLHDLFVSCEAVTPGQYKRQGQDLTIRYGVHPSPFGACLLAVTERGICALHFIRSSTPEEALAELRKSWPKALLQADQDQTRVLVERIFAFTDQSAPAPLHLYIRGTNFQIKVWEALLKIPLGRVVSYEDIAQHIGLPKAARAVGNAVGANPIPFLIPCHRVIRKLGDFGNYGSGPARKKAMLGWEASLITADTASRRHRGESMAQT